VKKYTSSCAQCTWNGEFDTTVDHRAANRTHHAETGHGVIGTGTVPDELLLWDRLYAVAENVAAAGLPINEALDAVRSGYSSIECDRVVAEDLADGDEEQEVTRG
jgi:hypothetical protein